MPFEIPNNPRKRIAIIGGGISGMGAAHALADQAQVVVFEGEVRLGGHARTIVAGKRGDQPVDTGFIVFNDVNYPNLRALFTALDVPVAESNMTFAASINGGWLEYALSDLNGLIGQRRNMVRPRFVGMLRDLVRFNARARDAVRDADMTIGDLLADLGTGDWFRDYYILPFSGAIWSTPTRKILDFPAHALVRFFDNHALLSHKGQHQWYTVAGGSTEYVSRLASALTRKGVDLRIHAPVIGVRRFPGRVEVRAEGGDWENFDEVILATHGDDSLRLLADPSAAERAALSKVYYQPNEAVLHADPSLMPTRRACWAAWNYTEAAGPRPDRIGLTYWMNTLQPIPKDDPLFVTLNAERPIDPALIHDVTTFSHPVYDHGLLEAQAEIRALNGSQGTWFCGAWMKNGFHEDGLSSALDVVRAMDARDAAPVAAE